MSMINRYPTTEQITSNLNLLQLFSSRMVEEKCIEWGFPKTLANAVTMIRLGLSRLEVASMSWARTGFSVGWIEYDEHLEIPEESIYQILFFVLMSAIINEGSDPKMFIGFMVGEAGTADIENATSMSKTEDLYTQNRADLDVLTTCYGDQETIAKHLSQILLRTHRRYITMQIFDGFSDELSHIALVHGMVDPDMGLYSFDSVHGDESSTKKDWLQGEMSNEHSAVYRYVTTWNRLTNGRFIKVVERFYL